MSKLDQFTQFLDCSPNAGDELGFKGDSANPERNCSAIETDGDNAASPIDALNCGLKRCRRSNKINDGVILAVDLLGGGCSVCSKLQCPVQLLRGLVNDPNLSITHQPKKLDSELTEASCANDQSPCS